MILEQTAARQTKLLSLLRREFGLSAGLVKRLKWQNALFVNGAPAHTDCPVQPGDRVRVVLEEQTEGFDPEPIPLSILYEDPYFLAVDKPAGMLVHPSPQKNSGTLANGVLYHLLERGEASGVHPVTRLDRDTFGVVILAKNANIHDRFCRMLRERQLEKTYLAAVFGQPPQENGQIDLPVYKVGGGSLIHQFCHLGKGIMLQGGALVNKDIPPYVKAAREPISYVGLNSVGLHRHGYKQEEIDIIAATYRILYLSDLNVSNAVKLILESVPAHPLRAEIIDVVTNARRGVIRSAI